MDALDIFPYGRGIAAEFLPQGHGHSILELCASHLDDMGELHALGRKALLQRDHKVVQQPEKGQPQGRGIDVVGRLRTIDVVVGMAISIGPLGMPHDLQRQIGDDLVGIHVRGRPRPALDAVHRELVEHVSGQDTITGGANGDADIPGQYLQFHIGQGTGFFDAGQGPDHFRKLGKRRSGDMEIVHGPQGLHAIVNRIIYGQFTQKIMLQPTHGTSCGYAEKDNA